MWTFGKYLFSVKGYDKRCGRQFYVKESGDETVEGAFNLTEVWHAIYRLVNLEHCPPDDLLYPMRQILPVNFPLLCRSFYEYPQTSSPVSLNSLKEHKWNRNGPHWYDSYRALQQYVDSIVSAHPQALLHLEQPDEDATVKDFPMTIVESIRSDVSFEEEAKHSGTASQKSRESDQDVRPDHMSGL